MKIKKFKRAINIKTFSAKFEYETIKGYRRKSEIIFNIADTESQYTVFKKWSESQRTMVNVTILSIVEIQESEIKVIEI